MRKICKQLLWHKKGITLDCHALQKEYLHQSILGREWTTSRSRVVFGRVCVMFLRTKHKNKVLTLESRTCMWSSSLSFYSSPLDLCFRLFVQHFHSTLILACLFWSIDSALEGPVLNITRVRRDHFGSYLCIANNGVPPPATHQVTLEITCKLFS